LIVNEVTPGRVALVAGGRCVLLDLFNLRAWRLVGRRGRLAILALAVEDGVFGRRQAILPLAMNWRLQWRQFAVWRSRLVFSVYGR